MGTDPARVSVYFHAPIDFRVERYAKLYNTTPEEAHKAIVKCDKQRKHYCRTFAGVDPSDARNYDLSIDTARIGSLEKAVELVLSYIQMR